MTVPTRLVERSATFVEATLRWLPLALLLGVAPGLFFAALRYPAARAQVLDNGLDAPLRLELLLFAASSLVVLGIVYVAIAVRHRRERTAEPFAKRLSRANDALLALLALPIVAALMTPDIETKAPGLTTAMGFAVGAVVFLAVLRAPRARVQREPGTAAAPSSAWLPRLVVLVLIAAYGVVASVFSVSHHRSLGTSAYDLGIYDNIMFQSWHGHPFGSVYSKMGTHLSAHFEPILVLLSPLYALWPRAEFLLVLQTFWIAMTALPLFELARHSLGRPWAAAGLAASVLLYPALHGTNFYDFHTLSLISPLVVAAIFALETGRPRSYWICFAVLLLTREDVPILLSLVGLHAILSRRAIGIGLASIALSAVYVAVAKLVVMPDAGLIMQASEESYSFAPYFAEMIPHESEGVFGLLVTVVTNPIFVLRHAFSPPKAQLLAQLFLPLFLLPLFAPRGKVMMLYGLAFLLLASRPQVFTLHFQYTATLFPVLFALTALALGRVVAGRGVAGVGGDRLVTALVAGILAATAASSAKFGALVPNESFRAGFVAPRFRMTDENRERYAWLTESIAAMQPAESVAATSEIAPHVSNRAHTGIFPRLWGSDWILVNVRSLRPWGRANLELLRGAGAYETVSERGGFERLRRRRDIPLPERLPEPERKERRFGPR